MSNVEEEYPPPPPPRTLNITVPGQKRATQIEQPKSSQDNPKHNLEKNVARDSDIPSCNDAENCAAEIGPSSRERITHNDKTQPAKQKQQQERNVEDMSTNPKNAALMAMQRPVISSKKRRKSSLQKTRRSFGDADITRNLAFRLTSKSTSRTVVAKQITALDSGNERRNSGNQALKRVRESLDTDHLSLRAILENESTVSQAKLHVRLQRRQTDKSHTTEEDSSLIHSSDLKRAPIATPMKATRASSISTPPMLLNESSPLLQGRRPSEKEELQKTVAQYQAETAQTNQMLYNEGSQSHAKLKARLQARVKDVELARPSRKKREIDSAPALQSVEKEGNVHINDDHALEDTLDQTTPAESENSSTKKDLKESAIDTSLKSHLKSSPETHQFVSGPTTILTTLYHVHDGDSTLRRCITAAPGDELVALATDGQWWQAVHKRDIDRFATLSERGWTYIGTIQDACYIPVTYVKMRSEMWQRNIKKSLNHESQHSTSTAAASPMPKKKKAKKYRLKVRSRSTASAEEVLAAIRKKSDAAEAQARAIEKQKTELDSQPQRVFASASLFKSTGQQVTKIVEDVVMKDASDSDKRKSTNLSVIKDIEEVFSRRNTRDTAESADEELSKHESGKILMNDTTTKIVVNTHTNTEQGLAAGKNTSDTSSRSGTSGEVNADLDKVNDNIILHNTANAKHLIFEEKGISPINVNTKPTEKVIQEKSFSATVIPQKIGEDEITLDKQMENNGEDSTSKEAAATATVDKATIGEIDLKSTSTRTATENVPAHATNGENIKQKTKDKAAAAAQVAASKYDANQVSAERITEKSRVEEHTFALDKICEDNVITGTLDEAHLAITVATTEITKRVQPDEACSRLSADMKANDSEDSEDIVNINMDMESMNILLQPISLPITPEPSSDQKDGSNLDPVTKSSTIDVVEEHILEISASTDKVTMECSADDEDQENDIYENEDEAAAVSPTPDTSDASQVRANKNTQAAENGEGHEEEEEEEATMDLDMESMDILLQPISLPISPGPSSGHDDGSKLDPATESSTMDAVEEYILPSPTFVRTGGAEISAATDTVKLKASEKNEDQENDIYENEDETATIVVPTFDKLDANQVHAEKETPATDIEDNDSEDSEDIVNINMDMESMDILLQPISLPITPEPSSGHDDGSDLDPVTNSSTIDVVEEHILEISTSTDKVTMECSADDEDQENDIYENEDKTATIVAPTFDKLDANQVHAEKATQATDIEDNDSEDSEDIVNINMDMESMDILLQPISLPITPEPSSGYDDGSKLDPATESSTMDVIEEYILPSPTFDDRTKHIVDKKLDNFLPLSGAEGFPVNGTVNIIEVVDSNVVAAKGDKKETDSSDDLDGPMMNAGAMSRSNCNSKLSSEPATTHANDLQKNTETLDSSSELQVVNKNLDCNTELYDNNNVNMTYLAQQRHLNCVVTPEIGCENFQKENDLQTPIKIVPGIEHQNVQTDESSLQLRDGKCNMNDENAGVDDERGVTFHSIQQRDNVNCNTMPVIKNDELHIEGDGTYDISIVRSEIQSQAQQESVEYEDVEHIVGDVQDESEYISYTNITEENKLHGAGVVFQRVASNRPVKRRASGVKSEIADVITTTASCKSQPTSLEGMPEPLSTIDYLEDPNKMENKDNVLPRNLVPKSRLTSMVEEDLLGYISALDTSDHTMDRKSSLQENSPIGVNNANKEHRVQYTRQIALGPTFSQTQGSSSSKSRFDQEMFATSVGGHASLDASLAIAFSPESSLQNDPTEIIIAPPPGLDIVKGKSEIKNQVSFKKSEPTISNIPQFFGELPHQSVVAAANPHDRIILAEHSSAGQLPPISIVSKVDEQSVSHEENMRITSTSQSSNRVKKEIKTNNLKKMQFDSSLTHGTDDQTETENKIDTVLFNDKSENLLFSQSSPRREYGAVGRPGVFHHDKYGHAADEILNRYQPSRSRTGSKHGVDVSKKMAVNVTRSCFEEKEHNVPGKYEAPTRTKCSNTDTSNHSYNADVERNAYKPPLFHYLRTFTTPLKEIIEPQIKMHVDANRASQAKPKDVLHKQIWHTPPKSQIPGKELRHTLPKSLTRERLIQLTLAAERFRCLVASFRRYNAEQEIVLRHTVAAVNKQRRNLRALIERKESIAVSRIAEGMTNARAFSSDQSLRRELEDDIISLNEGLQKLRQDKADLQKKREIKAMAQVKGHLDRLTNLRIQAVVQREASERNQKAAKVMLETRRRYLQVKSSLNIAKQMASETHRFVSSVIHANDSHQKACVVFKRSLRYALGFLMFQKQRGQFSKTSKARVQNDSCTAMRGLHALVALSRDVEWELRYYMDESLALRQGSHMKANIVRQNSDLSIPGSYLSMDFSQKTVPLISSQGSLHTLSSQGLAAHGRYSHADYKRQLVPHANQRSKRRGLTGYCSGVYQNRDDRQDIVNAVHFPSAQPSIRLGIRLAETLVLPSHKACQLYHAMAHNEVFRLPSINTVAKDSQMQRALTDATIRRTITDRQMIHRFTGSIQ